MSFILRRGHAFYSEGVIMNRERAGYNMRQGVLHCRGVRQGGSNLKGQKMYQIYYSP